MVLTTKQQRALSKAPKSQRANMLAGYKMQSGGAPSRQAPKQRAQAASYGAYPQRARAASSHYMEMLVDPAGSQSVGRPDNLFTGALLKTVRYEGTVTVSASGDVMAMYTPGQDSLITFTGDGDAMEMDAFIDPSFDVASEYSQGRVVAAVFEMKSDIIAAGSTAVTGRVVAAAINKPVSFVQLDPETVRSSGFSKSSVTEGDALEGARLLLPPLGTQEPRALNTRNLTGANQRSVGGMLYTNIVGSSYDDQTSGASTKHSLTAATVANPTGELPDNVTGPIRIQGMMQLAASSNGTGEFEVQVTRSFGGSSSTKNHRFGMDGEKYMGFSAFDNEQGVLEAVVLNVNSNLGQAIDDDSYFTVYFPTAGPSITEPVLVFRGFGLASGTKMRIFGTVVYEAMPGSGLTASLPDHVVEPLLASPN